VRILAAGQVDPDRRAHGRVAPIFEEKYGRQFRVAMVVERLIRRLRPTARPWRRVVRITAE
jgi:hypothetical protein